MNKLLFKKKVIQKIFYFIFLGLSHSAFSDNQTPTVSPVLPSTDLPFQIRIEQADFSLPAGLQSYAYGTHNGKWLLLTGRTNGLHGFDANDDNFPPNAQNTTVYVIDPKKKQIFSKSLYDPSSGLSQQQIDSLSVTSPQYYQWKKKLYISGGYGIDTATGLFSTKDILTSIDIPGLMQWVIHSTGSTPAAAYIRQVSDPAFQVTGGYMTRVNKDLSLLIFGQNFMGYYLPSSNGNYTQQVRRFEIEDCHHLKAIIESPESPNPSYRRRDLNIVPIIQRNNSHDVPSYVALSGVFTLSGGAWTVPVHIYPDGSSFMPDPSDPATFKQAMNNYACPSMGLFSKKRGTMYLTLFGGISFGYFENGIFQTDEELPFTNQVTTIQIDKIGQFNQFIMDNEYPTIISYPSGNTLLFGAGGEFIPNEKLSTYENGVIKFDNIDGPTLFMGYIVGGIQSKVPNTNVSTDSAASPYIFKVYLTKK